MATSSTKAVSLLQEMLNKQGRDCITLKWEQFYEVIERDRMSTEFRSEVAKKAKDSSVLVCYGNAVVLVAKDYAFSVMK